jgi:hypothetical protein
MRVNITEAFFDRDWIGAKRFPGVCDLDAATAKEVIENGWAEVTAKHVFHDPSKDWKPQTLWLRFSWFEDRPVDEYHGIRLDPVTSAGQQQWTGHPTADVAVLPLSITPADVGPQLTGVGAGASPSTTFLKGLQSWPSDIRRRQKRRPRHSRYVRFSVQAQSRVHER